jgi:hypothetical protein
MDTSAIISLIVLFALAGVWQWQKKKRPLQKAQQEAGNAVSSQAELEALQQTVTGLIGELTSIAEANIADLSARSAELNALIADAENKLAVLKAKEQEMRTSMKSLLAEMSETGAANRNGQSAIVPAALAQLISHNADEVEIAKELGIGRGEARLLLAMQKKQLVGQAA